jgi:hypothetical protein
MTLFTRPGYGGRVSIVLTIGSAVTTGYNILSNAGSTYVPGFSDFIVYVNANLTSTASGGGITFGALNATDSVNIIVATGVTLGGAGGGGATGDGISGGGSSFSSGPGGQGYPGIDMSNTGTPLFITNNGTIACGSGGGGGGGSSYDGGAPPAAYGAGGGGGGAGLNYLSQAGGPGNGGIITGFTIENKSGTAGSGTSGGVGGSANGGAYRGGTAGNGGAIGAHAGTAGSAGAGGTTHAPTAGGDYGYIVLNTGGATVTYVLHGTEIGH